MFLHKYVMQKHDDIIQMNLNVMQKYDDIIQMNLNVMQMQV